MRHDVIRTGFPGSFIVRPRVKVLASIGDVDPVNCSGGFVLQVGAGSPEIEWYEVDSDDDDAEVSVYRVPVECPEWADLADVAAVCDAPGGYAGINWSEAGMRNTDNMRRAVSCIEDVACYYGWRELDQYPLRMSRRKAEVRANRRARSLARNSGKVTK